MPIHVPARPLATMITPSIAQAPAARMTYSPSPLLALNTRGCPTEFAHAGELRLVARRHEQQVAEPVQVRNDELPNLLLAADAIVSRSARRQTVRAT